MLSGVPYQARRKEKVMKYSEATRAANIARGFPLPLWDGKCLGHPDKNGNLGFAGREFTQWRCVDCGQSTFEKDKFVWPRDETTPSAEPGVVVCSRCNKRRIDDGRTNTFPMRAAWDAALANG